MRRGRRESGQGRRVGLGLLLKGDSDGLKYREKGEKPTYRQNPDAPIKFCDRCH